MSNKVIGITDMETAQYNRIIVESLEGSIRTDSVYDLENNAYTAKTTIIDLDKPNSMTYAQNEITIKQANDIIREHLTHEMYIQMYFKGTNSIVFTNLPSQVYKCLDNLKVSK